MNSTLIIGGLFGIGLLSLVALLFVARGDEPQSAPEVASASLPAPTAQEAPPAEEQSPVSPPLPLREDSLWWLDTPARVEDLASEVKSAHLQAQEIERRLSLLSKAVERIERINSIHRSTRIEEELPHSPGMA